MALDQAGALARGATLYVTLEPCSHTGRTGPCVGRVIASGARRVVIATPDPNPLVNGQGIAALRRSGMNVQESVLAQRARELNAGFFSRHERGRPWVRVKIASSLDGRMALPDGRSKWLTSSAARADVQAWRARSCAVVTGVGTVQADDPRMTVREVSTNRQPLRVVLDPHLRIDEDAAVLSEPGALVFCAGGDESKAQRLRLRGVRVLEVPAAAGGVSLPHVLSALAAEECNEVLVEAGPRLATAFLRCGLTDEVIAYVAPMLIGRDGLPNFCADAPAQLESCARFQCVDAAQIGADVRLLLRPSLLSMLES
jgi:diaminohydroxyphosphoribosylaminopyrimidine deaminase/5-amino-6-(5-phosphoribosylamino)uracil reductase